MLCVTLEHFTYFPYLMFLIQKSFVLKRSKYIHTYIHALHNLHFENKNNKTERLKHIKNYKFATIWERIKRPGENKSK